MAAALVADLSNYTDNLLREIQDPNDLTTFSAQSADNLLGHLADAFWEARLDGLMEGYTCDDSGLITQISATNSPANPAQPYQVNTNMNWSADGQAREMVQLVILYASFRILRNSLRSLQTMFSVTAGAVKYETAQSATLLTTVMQDIINRRNIILARLSDLGTTQVTIIDSVMARDESLMASITHWVSAGDFTPGAYGYGYGDGGGY